MTEAFLIGAGQVHQLVGQRGETPPCPDAKFERGAVVKVRRNRRVGHFPAELIVLVAIPPGFSPDDAIADLLGAPRPLMKQVGSRSITYILCREGDQTPYHCAERELLPSGKEPVEIGQVSRASDAPTPSRMGRQAQPEGKAVKRYRAAVWQDGIEVASVSGTDPEAVRREAMHYAMVYAQDGPVKIRSRDYAALFGDPGAQPEGTDG